MQVLVCGGYKGPIIYPQSTTFEIYYFYCDISPNHSFLIIFTNHY